VCLCEHNRHKSDTLQVMGSSSKKGSRPHKDDEQQVKKKGSKKARSSISDHRRRRPVGGNDVLNEEARSTTSAESSQDGAESSDEDSVVPSKSASKLTATEKLHKKLKQRQREQQEEERRVADRSNTYKDDSTITSRSGDNLRTPQSSRTGQLVTPVPPDTAGTTNRHLILENTKLRRQLNGLSSIGVREEVLSIAIRKYAKVTLFCKCKFITNQARLNVYMADVMKEFHIEEKDRLHWGQTYQPDVCDAINQKRNHVAQNLRKVFHSK
jgi:hypothetical protein